MISPPLRAVEQSGELVSETHTSPLSDVESRFPKTARTTSQGAKCRSVVIDWPQIWYAGGSVPKRAGHDLLTLIEAFRATAEGLDDDANCLSEYVLSCAAEIADLDPRATAFRYPSEAPGELTRNAPSELDLARLSFTIDTISLCLDGLDGKIDLSRDEEYQAYLHSQ